MKRDIWNTNYKRKSYFLDYNDHQQFVLFVDNNSNVRFSLKLVEKSIEHPIACSNNMQILKDLVHAIQSGLEVSRITSSFKTLQITNLHLIC